MLRTVRGDRTPAEPEAFPQGGWTETWPDDAPPPDLARIAREVESAGNAGYARPRDLERYFEIDPPAPEDPAPFIERTAIEVSGSVVHCIDVSAPYSKILREVQRARQSADRNDG